MKLLISGSLTGGIQGLSSNCGMKFKDFQASVLFSSTFKALNSAEKSSRTFKDFQGCVGTLELTVTDLGILSTEVVELPGEEVVLVGLKVNGDALIILSSRVGPSTANMAHKLSSSPSLASPIFLKWHHHHHHMVLLKWPKQQRHHEDHCSQSKYEQYQRVL